jgi:hypothetical protein
VAVITLQAPWCVVLPSADWNMKSLWTWSTSSQHWLLSRVTKLNNMITWLGMNSCFEELPSRFENILIEQRKNKGISNYINFWNVFSNLFDMSMIYDCVSTEWCTFFIITCVLPLITSTKLYNTCPRYKHNIYLKKSN